MKPKENGFENLKEADSMFQDMGRTIGWPRPKRFWRRCEDDALIQIRLLEESGITDLTRLARILRPLFLNYEFRPECKILSGLSRRQTIKEVRYERCVQTSRGEAGQTT